MKTQPNRFPADHWGAQTRALPISCVADGRGPLLDVMRLRRWLHGNKKAETSHKTDIYDLATNINELIIHACATHAQAQAA